MVLTVEVDAGPVRSALDSLRRKLADLSAAWDRVGGRMEDASALVTPVASGALVDSLKAQAEADGVRFGSELIYAPVQDRGWPAHNIAAHRFMDRAEDELDRVAVEELESEAQALINSVGLG